MAGMSSTRSWVAVIFWLIPRAYLNSYFLAIIHAKHKYLGTISEQDGWVNIIHRGNRCDISLFQLGLRLLEHFLNEGLSIPVAFHISI